MAHGVAIVADICRVTKPPGMKKAGLWPAFVKRVERQAGLLPAF